MPVLSENSIEPSRGSMIVAEESTQSRAAPDGTDRTGRGEPGRNQPIVKALMIPLAMVMRHERREQSAQVGLTEHDDLIEGARDPGTRGTSGSRDDAAVHAPQPRRVRRRDPTAREGRRSIPWRNGGGGGKSTLISSISQEKWWRRRESNPRPKNLASETLHRYSVARFNHLPAQRTRQSNGDPVKFRVALRALRFPIR